MSDRIAELNAKYQALMHALQSGVAFDQASGSDDGAPKHLRVGVNSALISNGALISILVKKGILTEEEYMEELVVYTQRDVDYMKMTLKERYGVDVDLA
jgi:hypothetical protein